MSATARSRIDVTDHELVEAVRAGDDHAFERLYERYHRRIGAYILGMVRDHGRAEDLTQEAFVSALRRMRQTDREIHFKPWIYEIAKNACIDAFRRSRRAEEVSFDAEQESGGADAARLVTTTGAPEAAVDQKQRLDHLWGAFDGLSDAHHQILVMRELEGLSYAEIGERLGMSRASVESTLFRARRRLSEEYEELQTGEACRRAQGIIDSAATSAIGRRDQRRLGSHIARCSPCRREAVMAGLDAAVMARRPVRGKLAALLPLPMLRRRWGGAPDAPSGGGAHHAAAQWSAAAASYGDAPATWLKAGAAVAALALAGVGASSAVRGHHGAAEHGRSAAPAAVRSARSAGPLSAGHADAAKAARVRAGGTGGVGSSRPASTRPRSGAATSPAGTGAKRAAASQPAVRVPSAGSLVTAVTAPAQATTTTAGGAVRQVAGDAGTAVGGSTGQAVQQVGAAVGSGVDQVTTTATGAVQGVVDTAAGAVQGVTGTVAGTATTVTQAVDQTAATAGAAVSGATQAVGSTASGLLGQR